MTFKAKIDKILSTNGLGIASVSALEDFVGASRSSINDFYNKDKEPGRKTLKRILSLPELNKTWWETGEGDVFCHSFDEKPTHAYKKPSLMEKSDTKDEKSMQETIQGLVDMLKEDNAFLRESYRKLQESNEEMRRSLESSRTDYVKLTTITLAHGQK